MKQHRRVVVLLLLATALALAGLGQFYFFHRPDYVWDGVIFHGVAVLALLLAWRLATRRVRPTSGAQSAAPTLRDRLSAWRQPDGGGCGWLLPATLMAMGLGLSCAATFLALGRSWNQTTTDATTLWLLAMSTTLAAALWPATIPPDWQWRPGTWLRGVTRGTWIEIATVVGLTLLTGVLRIAALERVPYVLGGDEAWFGLTARQVLSGELRNPFRTGYVSMPTLFYWPVSWAMRWAGDGVTGLRLPAALVGTATVPALYLLARQLWGRRMALLSAAFLATYDYHIHYSRLGANNIWDPLFAVVTLWLVELGLSSTEERGRTRYFSLAGLVMGLSAYFYTGARLLPFLVLAYVAFAWIMTRVQKPQSESTPALGPSLVLLGLAFLVAGGPILGFALAHPDDWNARLNQVGIIQSGWLAREPGLTGKSTLQILAEQFLRAAGAFHVFPDRTVWYGADRPLLGFVAGALALLGMVWAGLRWRERRNFLVLIWFWSVIISAGMLTESPPSSQRFVIAIPAVAFLVALGLEQTVHLITRMLGWKDRRRENLVMLLVAVVLAVSSLHYYFVRFTPERRYGSLNGVAATMMGHYLRDLDGDYQVYFLGAPRIYWGFGTMPFLAPDVQGQDIEEPLGAPPDVAEEGKQVVFLFLPERAGELDWVQQSYPDGKLHEFSDESGQLWFFVYHVP